MININGRQDVFKIIADTDYAACDSIEVISVFDEDISKVTAPEGNVVYCRVTGDFRAVISEIKALPAAEMMIVYAIQNRATFDEDELDDMITCLDTLTRGKTAYGLKLTDTLESQFHFFLRLKG